MKHLVTVWKGLLFGLVIILCASQVGRARAATIQEMINAAPDGGTVTIPAGTGLRVISVTAGHNLTLNTLEVTGGQLADVGGGIFQEGASYSVTAVNSLIVSNTATSGHGGGLYGRGSASLTNTNVTYNTAHVHDGGMYVDGSSLHLAGGSINNNSALLNGGGVDAGWLEGNRLLFQNNYAVNSGGGVAVGVHLVLTNSRFIGNTATYAGGGGIYFNNGSFKGTNLLFAQNISSKGAALFVNVGPAELDFATIARPTRLNNDAAIYVETGGSLTLKDSLIASYRSGITVIGTLTEDYNLFFNNNLNFNIAGGSVNHGGHSMGSQDPLFVNPSTGDYHLRAGSPAIGNGIDLVPSVTTDLDGRPRLGRWDIGAYQYWAFLNLPLVLR